jgi:ArsR family transcriptional regulator, arsenate/arsenite/antimonite-responsive transcriptional repressor
MILIKNLSTKLTKREERIIRTMQAISDKTSFKIFKILRSGREMCVGEIAETLGVSSSAVSQHFKIFELVGLVNKKRYGQKVCYLLKTEDDLVQELTELF